MHNRLVIMAVSSWCALRGGSLEVRILMDRPASLRKEYWSHPQFDIKASSGNRVAFSFGAVASALRTRPEIVIVGHVNFASVALAVGAIAPSARQILLVFGIDAWHTLPATGRMALTRSDGVWSISEYTKRALAKHNDIRAERISLLPCALDPFYEQERLRLSEVKADPDLTPTALTVARLSRSDAYKGIDHAIRAFAEVTRRMPAIRYEIVGDGDDRPRLEGLARTLGVEDKVIFRGRVSVSELTTAYNRSRFFVMPSAKEGFGIVFLEAALFGKPSIAGNHGGSPEVVTDGREGFLVEYGDVGQLANRMEMLFSDHALAKQLGAAAIERLYKDFTYPVFERRCHALLDDTWRSRRS